MPQSNYKTKALNLIASGKFTLAEVSEICNVSYSTVSAWSRSVNGIHRKNPARLNDDQLKVVSRALSSTPKKYGINSDRWTARKLRDYIEQELGVPYSVHGIYSIMYRLGFEFQRRDDLETVSYNKSLHRKGWRPLT